MRPPVAVAWKGTAVFAALLASAWGLVGGGCAGTRTLGDGSVGSRLFYSRCRSCHTPVDPASKSPEFWSRYLGIYAERAKLAPAERDSVLAFLLRRGEEQPAAP